MYLYEFGPLLHTERIDTDDSPVAALFRGLEAVDVPVDVSEGSVDVLHDYIDPGALDRLFSGPHPARDTGFVVFELWGVVVQVTRHEVAIYDSLSVEATSDSPSDSLGQRQEDSEDER
ncbi:HalOD1 output domain-containing protein [Halogeometricum limi]|uniref:Halobacterial output domain-containing protein n=1 Tax=Halogeometricum limi TaxID=555875 RepID=A0A1I6FVB6_9EURY|nr:HalOD1 output domain-containing protein [Halogeometricum limi]SFR33848.1 hypothetical protein SAMN04488124_0367 [Halogeometricum limi]